MRVREMSPKDLSYIIHIRRVSLVKEFELFGLEEEVFVRNLKCYRLLKFINRYTGKFYFRVYVAETRNDVVGVSILSKRGPYWHISGVMIDPKHRRRGYAKLLVSRICREAERYGAKEIYLNVLEDNAAALALYSSLGFEDYEKSLLLYADWGDLRQQDLPQGVTMVRLRENLLFRLFASALMREFSEKFAIVYYGKTIGTLGLHSGSHRKTAVTSLRLLPDYTGIGIEEPLLSKTFELAHKKGANRLILEASTRTSALQRNDKRYNLKFLCVVSCMIRQLKELRV